MTSVFCTSTSTATDGSTRDSASIASTAWKKRGACAAVASGISIPMTPSSNRSSMSDRGMWAWSSISRTSGRISRSANSKTLSRNSRLVLVEDGQRRRVLGGFLDHDRSCVSRRGRTGQGYHRPRPSACRHRGCVLSGGIIAERLGARDADDSRCGSPVAAAAGLSRVALGTGLRSAEPASSRRCPAAAAHPRARRRPPPPPPAAGRRTPSSPHSAPTSTTSASTSSSTTSKGKPVTDLTRTTSRCSRTASRSRSTSFAWSRGRQCRARAHRRRAIRNRIDEETRFAATTSGCSCSSSTTTTSGSATPVGQGSR